MKIFRRAGGEYQFRYKYGLYFFIARYIRDRMNSEPRDAEIYDLIESMSQRLFNEVYANVLMFLVYLTSDVSIIKKMVQHGRELFDNYSPCELEADAEFLMRNRQQLPGVTYELRDHKTHRTERGQSRDEYEEPDMDDDLDDLYRGNRTHGSRIG